MNKDNLNNYVDQFRNADNSAFEKIFDLTDDEMYAHARMLTDTDEAARNLLQETYTEIIWSISELDDAEEFILWSYKKMLRVSGHGDDSDVEAAPDEIKNAALFEQVRNESMELQLPEGVDAVELNDLAREAVNALPVMVRMTAMFHYCDDFTDDEIAKLENAAAETVKARLYYARIAIKNMMMEFEDEQDVDLAEVTPTSVIKTLFESVKNDRVFEKAPMAASIILGRVAEAANFTDDVYGDAKSIAQRVAENSAKAEAESAERAVADEPSTERIFDKEENDRKNLDNTAELLYVESASYRPNMSESEKVTDEVTKPGRSRRRMVLILIITILVAAGATLAGFIIYNNNRVQKQADIGHPEALDIYKQVSDFIKTAPEPVEEPAGEMIDHHNKVKYISGGRWGEPGTDNSILEFTAGGSITSSNDENVFKGKWYLDGNTIYVTWNDGSTETLYYDPDAHTINSIYYREDMWQKIINERGSSYDFDNGDGEDEADDEYDDSYDDYDDYDDYD